MPSAFASDREVVDELTKEFLAESLEGLDRMDRCLTELEARPHDAELLGEIFRAVHTIKGTTGFLGFSRLETLAHAGENLLGALRDGRLTANADLVNGLLRLMDGLRNILQLIERTGREGDRAEDDDADLIALMGMLLENKGKPAQEQGHSMQQAGTQSSSQTNEKTLRIGIEVLNRMVNLVGELVLTRNQILQMHAESANLPELARRLDSGTADLRETVMRARMQPVGHLFGKFPRMVRDLARSCGKSVRIEFAGQDTELDKTLLEAVKDPLTHALRNAIDHGIEGPQERILAGKLPEGVVTMRARHQSGSVVIEIEDDGHGISRDRVLAKALAQGLITEERAACMTDREAQQIIFLPGFSTAAAVSHVSGRGVGMDVVRNNVEKVGGSIEVESREGRGTLLRLRVPLTLAIVPALVVQSGGQSFCLPQGSLAELVCVLHAEAEAAVERIGEVELYRLREELLPMVWLDHLLGLEANRTTFCAQGFYLAVLESDGCRFGLVVDELLAPEEIVVKPVSGILRDIGLFSGATVLGNGTLAMILDVGATAVRAGIGTAVTERPRPQPVALKTEAKRPSFLIFEDEREGRMALPLGLVERIETVPVRMIEGIGGRLVVQDRGQLLPVEDVRGTLGNMHSDQEQEQEQDPTVTMLICRLDAGSKVGLVVRRVLDVADGELLEEDTRVYPGRLALVHDRVTVVRAPFAAGQQSASLQEAA